MRELSGDKCYGCGHDDELIGVGFYINNLEDNLRDPVRGYMAMPPTRPGSTYRTAYSAILCTRCCQHDETMRVFALAVADEFVDVYAREAQGWQRSPQAEEAWARVRPADIARRRAQERRVK